MEVKLSGITRSYGNTRAASDISFQVRPGEIHGILGPNGAGKSTLLRIISGRLKPDSGTLEINGKTYQDFPRSIKSRLGILPENPAIYEELTVKEYLEFFARIKDVPRKQINSALERVCQMLKLESVWNRYLGHLSRGFRQRAAIAQSIVNSPDLLILDEPTLGLDPESVTQIRNLILSLKSEHTVIVSSHLLHEMELICDTVTIIKQGNLIVSRPIEQLRQQYMGEEVFNFSFQKREDTRNHCYQDNENLELALKKLASDHDIEISRNDNRVFGRVVAKKSFTRTGQRPGKEIIRVFQDNKVELEEFWAEKQELEDLFLKLTSDSEIRSSKQISEL
jgi:ABC-2 type transport system ATP-binding protein